ncbi:Hypothetical predicted protein [Olea europaea subsp. europaea]|uniref:NET domain-containing protein n=1 Tax=Olea europaea subsp. europaea TaxID=158383 RepID=A0A8S0TWS4_OLEEU|nr:Hypothetical predicted protein [Olea europaea subsp. europaea]
MVLQNCRKMSTEEKRRLSSAIAKLCPEDIDKAVEIVAQRNPDFQAAREDVEINMDAQTESTLWKLKFFIRDALHDWKNSPNINEDNLVILHEQKQGIQITYRTHIQAGR